MATDLFQLKGKGALVTGGTRGIGFAIARELGLAGGRVMISSENAAECAEAVRTLVSMGIDADGLVADANDLKAVDDLVESARAWLGNIDVLVCNAGVSPHMGPIAEASDSQWDLTMTVNLRSPLRLTSRIIPGMAERGGGSVVLMSSIAGLRGNKALGLYALSKAGLAQLARNLAVEWGPRNVRVNAIAPGLIQTDFAKPLLDSPEILERRIAQTPLRRVGTPAEIASVALLLASPAGGFISGQNIVVDGGTTIGDGN